MVRSGIHVLYFWINGTMQWMFLFVVCLATSGIAVSSAVHPDDAEACPEMLPCECLRLYQPDLSSTANDPWREVNVLQCDHKCLTSVPDLTPIVDLGITRIWLSHNDIQIVRKNDFMDIEFEEVMLNSNPLKRIHPQAFQHMKTSIRRLVLSGPNNLEISEDGIEFLSGMVNLTHLNLGWSKLKGGILKRGVFDRLNLTNLNELILAGNRINTIEKGALGNMKSLTILDVGTNDFLKVPVEITKMKGLKELSLASVDGLKLSENSFKGLLNLEKLTLSYMSLKKVPGSSIEKLDKLKQLDLSHNKIKKISPNDFAGNYNLKNLSLGGNPIGFRQGMFGRHSNSLEYINLVDTKLAKLLLEVFQEMAQLNGLGLSHCNFRKIDDGFFSNLSLSEIDLSNNEELDFISPKAFIGMKKPLLLDLRSTALTDISFLVDAPPCTFVFTMLDINFNKIPCDCMLERVIHSGQVGGNFSGTCHYGNDSSWYFSVHNSNLVSIPVGLESHLTAQCGKTKRQYACQSSSAAENISVYGFILVLFVLFGS